MFQRVIGHRPADETTPETAAPVPTAPASYGAAPAPAPAASAPASYGSAAPASATPAAASRSSLGPSRNVLSSDVEIKGTVKFTNDLVADGRIEGEIHSDGNLVVGENARLKAEIRTASVVIHGKVHGNITAIDRVELKASAEVVGDIKAKSLSMEAGAIFVGKSTIGTPSTPASKPAAAASTAAPAKSADPAPAQGS